MSVRRITLAQANHFLEWRKSASLWIAAGTFLCIIAVIPLLILGAVSEFSAYHISENLAAGAGLTALFISAAVAVAIFLLCGFKNAPFEFIDKEPFETEYGVTGMVREQQKAYRKIYTIYNVIGACVCVLSPVPLFIGIFMEEEFFMVIMLIVTMLLAGIGAVFFIISGVRWASMQKLLKEGDFTPQEKRKSQIKEKVSAVYWLSATVIYLGWSFWTNAWGDTWIVWPVAGVMFAVVMCLCNLFIAPEK